MTNKPQEVYNHSSQQLTKLFGIPVSAGANEVSKANRNLVLTSAIGLTGAGDPKDSSVASALTSTLILRYDYLIPEDVLLKKFFSTIVGDVITVAEATTGESMEVTVNYTPPNSAVTQTVYDETLTSAIAIGPGATSVFIWNMPPRPLQVLMAKGGLITVIITAIVTSAGGGTVATSVYCFRRDVGQMSFLGFDFSPLNTAKDMELLNERLPT